MMMIIMMMMRFILAFMVADDWPNSFSNIELIYISMYSVCIHKSKNRHIIIIT